MAIKRKARELKRKKQRVVVYPLTEYIEAAMARATYEILEDGVFCGNIPSCWGVVAFAKTLAECEKELRAVLEGWLLLGLQFGDTLPVIDGIDLNGKVKRERLVPLQAA